MKKKGFIITTIILVIIIIALGVGLFLLFNDKQKIEEDNKKLNDTISALQQDVKNSKDEINDLIDKIDNLEKNNNDDKDNLTEEDYVKNAFEKQLKEEKGLKEYNIEKIKILDREELEETFGDDVLQFENSIPAEITYSVRPTEEGYDYWIAGNGEIDGEWIRNKVNVVEVTKTEKGYTITNEGTGW